MSSKRETDVLALRDAVQRHLEAVELTPEQIAALQHEDARRHQRPEPAKTATGGTGPDVRPGDGEAADVGPGRQTRRQHLAIAATIFVGVATGFAAGRWHGSAPVSERITEETVHNHRLNMPLEIRGKRVADLRGYFAELKFTPEPPGSVVADSTLLGGRYCTIQGTAAAQLRYGTPDGSYATVYQVLMPNDMRENLPLTRTHDGLRVDMWQNGRLLMVRVNGPSPDRHAAGERADI